MARPEIPGPVSRGILVVIGVIVIVVLIAVVYFAQKQKRAENLRRRDEKKEELVVLLRLRDSIGFVDRWSHLHSIGCDSIMREEQQILMQLGDTEALPVLREAIGKTPQTLQRWVDTSEVDTQSLSYPTTAMIKELVDYENPVRLAFAEVIAKLESQLAARAQRE
jgi:hypothetical protein